MFFRDVRGSLHETKHLIIPQERINLLSGALACAKCTLRWREFCTAYEPV